MAEVVSFGLFVFNHEQFVREAIEGIYAQTYRPLELIVSEDASTDGSRLIIDELLGKAPAGVNIIKIYQDTNKGLANAVNAIARHASGKVIVFGAGDDISEPNRVESSVALFTDPNVMFVHSAHSVIDKNGRTLSSVEKNDARNGTHSLSDLINRKGPAVLGATASYRKDVFEYFSPLRPEIVQEDALLPFRALLLGKGRYLPEPLVRYRTHGGNISFGGIDACSDEIVRRFIRMQNNRLALALNKTDDLSRHLARGRAAPEELTRQLAADLLEAETEVRIVSGKSSLNKMASILQGLFGRKLRFAAAVKFFFIYVIPRWYTFALWIRKKQRLS
jgi:glycosyltransferase involved in cell wall biosynthesis